MNFQVTKDQIVPISEHRKNAGRLEEELRKRAGKFAITNNGRVIAFVFSPEKENQYKTLQPISLGLAKKKTYSQLELEKQLQKAQFKGSPNLSQEIDTIIAHQK